MISPVHAAIVMHVFQSLQDLMSNVDYQLFWHAIRESACHRQSLASAHLIHKSGTHMARAGVALGRWASNWRVILTGQFARPAVPLS